MTAYRDDLAAAHRRISELEEQLQEDRQSKERAEATALRAAYDLELYRRRLDPSRSLRRGHEVWIALAAMLALVLALFQYARRLEAENELQRALAELEGARNVLSERRAEARNPPTFAEPVAPPMPPPAEPAEIDDSRFDPANQKKALLTKLHRSTATMDEARILKALCMADGDRACRDAAVAHIKRLRSEP